MGSQVKADEPGREERAGLRWSCRAGPEQSICVVAAGQGALGRISEQRRDLDLIRGMLESLE